MGVDVVEVARLGRSLERTPALMDRLFTTAEQGVEKLESLAARFAAKEAVAKALGAPRDLQWHDVEVLRSDVGRPSLQVTGSVAGAAASLGIVTWHVSLSHDAGAAVAMVVAES